MHATLATAADASWLFPFERVEVFCHHATLLTREMESLTCSSNLEGHFTVQTMHQLPREERWGYVQEDRAFIDSIVNNSPPLVTALDGLIAVRIADAVYESVRRVHPVCKLQQHRKIIDLFVFMRRSDRVQTLHFTKQESHHVKHVNRRLVQKPAGDLRIPRPLRFE